MRRVVLAVAVSAALGVAPAARSEEVSAPEAAASAPSTQWVFYLRDGRTLRGAVVARDAFTITLLLAADGQRVRFEEDLVRRVEGPPLPEAPPRPPPPWRQDPSGSRALASPTGLLPAAGEVTVLTRLATIGAQVGVLGLGEVGVEAMLPVLYARDAAGNALLRASAGWRLGPVALRGGAAASLHAGGVGAVFLFGAATLGDADRHLSLYAGPSLPGAVVAGGFADVGASVEGAWRFHRWFGAATEHWVGDADGGRRTAHALALRLFTGPAAIDVGALLVPHIDRVTPWVGVSWQVSAGRAP